MTDFREAPSRVAGRDAVEIERRNSSAPHLLNGALLTTKKEFLTAIAHTLDFPSYFGHNLDALYDVLTDLSWLPEGRHVLIWTRHNELRGHDPIAYLALRAVMEDAVRAGTGDSTRRLAVVLTQT
jgi:RNAse (barnase) inhibitor barstar